MNIRLIIEGLSMPDSLDTERVAYVESKALPEALAVLSEIQTAQTKGMAVVDQADLMNLIIAVNKCSLEITAARYFQRQSKGVQVRYG